ncbi:3-oxoacyl-[acyl-carrier protein] reductase [Asanoa hainanensis]|uniref:3-oxoacyl-[acyl-carrier protein] reductase n=1 Tax=Asanoa hainanensis TaxID=560556 RepID=A0A239P554_9ACTN|nr:SDR family oxidoreductase [Asanoa hainanensis]SNT62205.1 3-oxoacyl-[acyl-carrier protein] reductase [Asanoa hainanensis]
MTDRVALVTGVSRRAGIGAAVARRLADDGHQLLLSGFASYDDDQPYGGDPDGVPAIMADLTGGPHHYSPCDLTDPAAPAALVRTAVERFGRVDTLVAVHTYSTSNTFGNLDAGEIDRHLIVNVRATMLLIEAYAAAHDRGAGRVVLFSSGQRLGPMTGEIPYAVSKAAVENLTQQLGTLLMHRGITINCLNPGPTDTGWATPDDQAAAARLFPGGRWGTPDDAARLVGWLCSPDASWVTGQVIDSEGGFNRYG